MPLSKLPRPLTSSVRCATHSRTSSKTMRCEGVACVWALDANSPPVSERLRLSLFLRRGEINLHVPQ